MTRFWNVFWFVVRGNLSDFLGMALGLSLTIGESGTVTLEDLHLFEKNAHFNRERVPERVVHAKGAGAHGYFEVTQYVMN